ncbi:MAG: transposase [Chloroflexi bacterium]|nr:transposase [Chloroflexota bacterium]
MPRSRYRVYENFSPHFLTCTLVNWLPLFKDPNLIDILYASLRFMQKHNRLTIYAYVFMDTHLHLVAASVNLSKEIANFKSFTARRIIDTLKEKKEKKWLEQLAQAKAPHKKDRQFQVWQEGSHPQALQNKAMMRQKIEYIHYNPVKRGLVDEPVQWVYSSAANYAGLPGLLDVEQNW